MRMKWLFLAALLMFAPMARADTEETQIVPRGHWSYEALKILESVQVDNVPLFKDVEKKALEQKLVAAKTTRYEIGVVLARLMERLAGQIQLTGSLDLRAVEGLPLQSVTAADPKVTPEYLSDLIASLRREYVEELVKLGVNVGEFEEPYSRFLPKTTLPENFVSPTFGEILTRVYQRDPKIGAIVSIKPKADAPQRATAISPAVPLRFSLAETADGQSAVIALESSVEGDKSVYETYRLRIDKAMREELRLQKLLQEAQKTK